MEIANAHSLSQLTFLSFASLDSIIISMHPTTVAIAGAPPNAKFPSAEKKFPDAGRRAKPAGNPTAD